MTIFSSINRSYQKKEMEKAAEERIKSYRERYVMILISIITTFTLTAVLTELFAPEYFNLLVYGTGVILILIALMATVGYKEMVRSEKQILKWTLLKIEYLERVEREEFERSKKRKKTKEERDYELFKKREKDVMEEVRKGETEWW